MQACECNGAWLCAIAPTQVTSGTVLYSGQVLGEAQAMATGGAIATATRRRQPMAVITSFHEVQERCFYLPEDRPDAFSASGVHRPSMRSPFEFAV
jgi:hypothetical protein